MENGWRRKRITKQEDAIWRLLCLGATPKSIARKLHIALNTVYQHTGNLRQKLNVHSAEMLILTGIAWGIVDIEEIRAEIFKDELPEGFEPI